MGTAIIPTLWGTSRESRLFSNPTASKSWSWLGFKSTWFEPKEEAGLGIWVGHGVPEEPQDVGNKPPPPPPPTGGWGLKFRKQRGQNRHSGCPSPGMGGD